MADTTKPRGRALHRTERDLDRLSEITPEDIERARAAWHADAPRAWRGLVDADPDEDS